MTIRFLFRSFLAAVLVALGCLFLSTSARAAGAIESHVSFSTDDGKTYTEAQPSIGGAREIWVKVDFSVVGEDRPIEGSIVTTSLRSDEADFASANLGRQSWTGKPGWYQRIETSWFSVQRPQTAIYKLDLRARPQGVVGRGNKWDSAQRTFVDGPLPVLPARGAGAHKFVFRMGYRVQGVTDPVTFDVPFQVTIGSEAAAAPPVVLNPMLPADAPALPVLEGLKVWDSTQWQLVDGPGKLVFADDVVKTRPTQEPGLRLTDFTAGDYYLRAFIESGSGNGEDELAKDLPYFYLNGRPIDFGRATPVAPFTTGPTTTNVTIIESRDRVHLEPGDELRWNTTRRAYRLFGDVAIAAKPLAFAPVEVKPFYDPALQDVFRVTGTFKVPATTEPGDFSYELRNFSGKAGVFQVHLEVRDYWQKVVASKDDKLSLPSAGRQTVSVPFPQSDTDKYRAIVRVTAPDGTFLERVFDKLVDNPRGARPRVWLNEGWEWTSIADNGTLATRTLGEPAAAATLTGWQKMTVPASWQDLKPADHIAWHRLRFSVPAAMAGRRLFLNFARVTYEARVSLNGKLLGDHFGQNGPFNFEITSAVKPGENELLLGVRDGIAALEQDELKNARLEMTQRARLRAPAALKCGVGEVWLDGAGPQPIRDVFVQSSFRKKNLQLTMELPELPAGTTVSNRVLFEGKEVLRFADAAVPAGNASLTVTQAWPNPILWNPGDPKLLQLVTELKGADGKMLDHLDTRFGFREFWPEGRKLLWNGAPVKFAAIPFLSTWGWGLAQRGGRETMRDYVLLTKRMGANMQRHIYDPVSRAEVNDEEGIVFASSFGGIAYPTKQMVDSDEFWKNAAAFDSEQIRGMRNNPSVVEWYASNEFWGAFEPANQKRLQELGKALALLDPTRIQEFGCDLDLGGYSNVISTHYPVDVRALREEKGVFPEAAYWRRFDAPLKEGDKAPGGIIRNVANVRTEAPISWGAKPLVINETLWNYFFNTPDGLTRLAGEDVYSGPNAAESAYKEANRWFIRGHRDAEASVITPWEFLSRDPIGLEFPTIEINPLQRYSHFYSGQAVPYDVNLHSDRMAASKLDFTWTLTVDGKVLQRESQPLAFDSGELKRMHLDLKMPAVKAETAGAFTLTLAENGKELRRVSLPANIYPRTPIAFPAGLKVGLYDPDGRAAKALKGATGPAPATITALNDASLRDIKVLIIGANGAQSGEAAGREALGRFLTRGGRVLVLAQEKAPAALPVRLSTTGLVANKMFSFRPGSAALKGLNQADFEGWFPAERSGFSFYLKPEDGNWKTLLESGGPNGLIYSGLLETSFGDGLLVCSQLDLTSNLETNPIAGTLWNNLLSYLATAPAAAKKAGVWTAEKGTVGAALKQIGANAAVVKSAAELKGLDVLVLEADAKLSAVDTAAIGQFVSGGGQLLLHGVTPNNRANVAALCGTAVRVLEPAPRAWSGRAVKMGPSDLLAGLTDYDLFWKRRPDTEEYMAAYVNDASTLAPLGNWSLEVPASRALLYPAYLAELPMGKGRIFLDNLNWDKALPQTKTNSKRIAATLLTNLGVRLEAPQPIALPTGLTYRPVDISAVLNRSFTDEVADDGKGGFTDQGPEQDLRSFPTEPAAQNFVGVPVRIEKERSALVLASQFRKPGPPQTVELPVSGHADALFFLQTTAWTSKAQHGSYVVRYADGTQYEIKLIGDVNLRDWMAANAADGFSMQTDTVTRLAWTGAAGGKPVNVFLMAWPNPHPDREIRSVTFTSTNTGVPVLIGVTVGVKQAGAVTAPVAAQGDSAAAKKLVDEGKALRRAGQPDEAAKKFEAAKTADATADASYLELAALRESQNRWVDAIASYQALVKMQPDHLEALYRLGKAQQEAKQWDEAEKTFRHSLEVNRNQPDVLQALNDLLKRRP